MEDRISKSKLVAWAWTLRSPAHTESLWACKTGKALGKVISPNHFEVAFTRRRQDILLA